MATPTTIDDKKIILSLTANSLITSMNVLKGFGPKREIISSRQRPKNKTNIQLMDRGQLNITLIHVARARKRRKNMIIVNAVAPKESLFFITLPLMYTISEQTFLA